MPYPIALVALAASAAGTGLQMAGANKARREMQSAQNAEAARQKRYQDEAAATFQRSLEKSKRADADATIDAKAAKRVGAYDRIAVNAAAGRSPTAPQTTTATTASTAAAGRTTAATKAAGNAWTRLVGNAQARLGGTEDWGLDRSIENTRARQDLAITGSNARSSAGLLNNEMAIASHAGDGLNAWGSLASALGSLAGTYAAVTPAGGGGEFATTPDNTINQTVDVPDWRLEEVANIG